MSTTEALPSGAQQDHDGGYPALWDWRRRVSDLYGAVRAEPDPRRAWQLWRATRDGLFRDHPQSPLEAAARRGFAGLPYFDYDPRLRFEIGQDDRVQAIHVGRMPQLAYVEGCA